MSSAYAAVRPSRIRAIGVAVALLLLVLLAVLAAVVVSGRSISLPAIRIGIVGAGGAPANRAFAAATLLVACVFSWLLAEMAVRPGWRPAIVAALVFAVGAVVLGSFLVAGLASFSVGGGIATMIGSTLVLGLLGVVIDRRADVGDHAALAVVWVALVRAVVRLVA